MLCVSKFPFHALPRAWIWISEVRKSVAGDEVPGSLEEFLEWCRGYELLAVTEGDQEVAMGWWRELTPNTALAQFMVPKHRWRTEDAARYIRAAAWALLHEYGKVLTTAFQDSTSVIRALKMVPFRREGTIRAYTVRLGKPVDAALFGAMFKEVKDAVSDVVVADLGFGCWSSGLEAPEAEFELEPELAVHAAAERNDFEFLAADAASAAAGCPGPAH
jgi:hypothetical protein